jgi:hypothetical protein
MRVALIDDVLRMKRGPNLFERLDTVLREIKKFTDFHDNEFLFLDFDFPYGEERDLKLEYALVKMLKEVLGERNFETAHVDRSEEGKPGKSYTYNKELVWERLSSDRTHFIIIWPSQIESGIP